MTSVGNQSSLWYACLTLEARGEVGFTSAVNLMQSNCCQEIRNYDACFGRNVVFKINMMCMFIMLNTCVGKKTTFIFDDII